MKRKTLTVPVVIPEARDVGNASRTLARGTARVWKASRKVLARGLRSAAGAVDTRKRPSPKRRKARSK